MRFNRNVFTEQDIRNHRSGKRIPALDAAPPAGTHPAISKAAETDPAVKAATDKADAVTADAASPDAAATGPGGVTVPTADDYITKLLKFVPIEIVGLYLFLDSLERSNTAGTTRAVWLGITALAVVAFTVLYDMTVLQIERWQQWTVSAVGMAVYVFTVGGWFGTTTWYQPWYGGVAAAVFAIGVAILKLPALQNGEQVAANAAAKTSKKALAAAKKGRQSRRLASPTDGLAGGTSSS